MEMEMEKGVPGIHAALKAHLFLVPSELASERGNPQVHLFCSPHIGFAPSQELQRAKAEVLGFPVDCQGTR